MFHSLLKQTLE